MTNLEFYKDEIKNRMKKEKVMCTICLTKNSPSECCDIKCLENEHLIDWLFEECKEPIKLKQWEYDVASYYHNDTNFDTWSTLVGLKEKGHFKGITDTSMTLREILDNCIIVADDYEWFEDTK